MPSSFRTLVPALGLFLVSALCSFSSHGRDLRFITIDVAPWASIDPEKHEAVGVFVDVVNELEKRSNRKISVSLQPFARIPHELEAGRADCTILIWDDKWSRFMEKGEVVSTHVFGVIARKGVPLKRFEDLHGLNVSVMRSLSLGERFDTDPDIKRQIDTDYLMGLNKLAHRRLDAVAGAIPTIRYLARQNRLDDHLGDQLTLSEVTLPLQCTKGSPELDATLTDLNKAIRAMHQDGFIESVKKKFNYY